MNSLRIIVLLVILNVNVCGNTFDISDPSSLRYTDKLEPDIAPFFDSMLSYSLKLREVLLHDLDNIEVVMVCVPSFSSEYMVCIESPPRGFKGPEHTEYFVVSRKLNKQIWQECEVMFGEQKPLDVIHDITNRKKICGELVKSLMEVWKVMLIQVTNNQSNFPLKVDGVTYYFSGSAMSGSKHCPPANSKIGKMVSISESLIKYSESDSKDDTDIIESIHKDIQYIKSGLETEQVDGH